MKKITFQILLFVISAASVFARPLVGLNNLKAPKLDTATFATGCFWCTEAKFQQIAGVVKVISGFAGGHVANPSYELVCTGTTGHAETCNIIYDPAKVTYDAL